MLQMESRTHGFVSLARGKVCAAALAASLIASAGMLGCSGAASQEQAAQDAVTSVTSGLATESGTASELLTSVLFYPQDYGVGEDAFCEWYFDGADVEVEGVDVQGDSATVRVAFNAKRMAEVLPILEQARDQALADGADVMRDGYANERFAAAVANAQVGTDRLEVAVPVTRGSDGAWAIDDRATLAAALLDGYDPRQISID